MLARCNKLNIRLVHTSTAILFRVLVFRVAMGLFIDCHFLFKGQSLCLSLHNEILSFEGSEWSRGC